MNGDDRKHREGQAADLDVRIPAQVFKVKSRGREVDILIYLDLDPSKNKANQDISSYIKIQKREKMDIDGAIFSTPEERLAGKFAPESGVRRFGKDRLRERGRRTRRIKLADSHNEVEKGNEDDGEGLTMGRGMVTFWVRRPKAALRVYEHKESF